MSNSMINPSVVELTEKTGDRYSLVVITSKRARQIIGGSEAKIDLNSEQPLSIAINEVNQGKIEFESPDIKDSVK